MRFFPVLVRELLADFLDFDSRFTRTMKPLLLHPGRLTRDYLDGRRFRYTPPLRLYIFASMAFFLIAAMLASSAITIGGSESGTDTVIHLGSGSVNEQLENGLKRAVEQGDMSAEEAAEAKALVEKATTGKLTDEAGSESSSEDDVINLNGEPWNRETNPFLIPGAPDFINDWINDEIEGSPAKGREIEANPDIIKDKMFDVLPIAVFIMLPLVALILKFWYLFSGHYYVEHLVHSLHNHAFLFVIFMLMIVADSLSAWLDPGGERIYSKLAQGLSIVIMVWVPLYLLISLKTVYRQGWAMTLGKFCLVGISYMMLMVAVTATAALASFVLL